MAQNQRLICASGDVDERGFGVGFCLPDEGESMRSGFVIRYGGVVHGYVNRCAHASVTLDWAEGSFLIYPVTT